VQNLDNQTEFSHDQIEEYRSKVWVIHDNVILFKSLPMRVKEITSIQFQKLDELTQNMDYYYLITDSTEIKERGGAEYRNWLSDELNKRNKIRFLYIIVDKSSIIRFSIKYMLSKVIGLKFNVFDKIEPALNHIQKLENDT